MLLLDIPAWCNSQPPKASAPMSPPGKQGVGPHLAPGGAPARAAGHAIEEQPEHDNE